MASVFPLPENGDSVVGEVQYQTVSDKDTLLDVARQYDVGYNEIVAANPGVNPWLPKNNYRVVVPNQYVLPPKPWHGIIVNLPEMRLYYFPPETGHAQAKVFTMPLSIGRINWQTPTGQFYVKAKVKDPSWTMPASIVAEGGMAEYGNRRVIPPRDEQNPLGNYALQLSRPGYLIHGTNKPFSIGWRVSHGCLRMYPEDIKTLFALVSKDTPVRIINQPVKIGRLHNWVFVETHPVMREDHIKYGNYMTHAIMKLVQKSRGQKIPEAAWLQLESLASHATGLPTPLFSLNQPNQAGH
jgi:L,D-transpeptidase ErfK/SrfK